MPVVGFVGARAAAHEQRGSEHYLSRPAMHIDHASRLVGEKHTNPTNEALFECRLGRAPAIGSNLSSVAETTDGGFWSTIVNVSIVTEVSALKQ
jgi:hypothetical protein